MADLRVDGTEVLPEHLVEHEADGEDGVDGIQTVYGYMGRRYLRVDGAEVLPEHLVEHEADGVGDGREKHHEELHDPERVGAEEEPVARARRLRDDLAEDDDEQGGDHASEDAARQIRHQDSNQRCREPSPRHETPAFVNNT
eukprot:1577766-Pyramimonas_sp.AAC.3